MNKGHKPKAKEGNDQEQLQPNEALPPPPPPATGGVAAAASAVSEEAPKPHKQGKDKFNQGQRRADAARAADAAAASPAAG